jgi:SAM-dependent methyltransferase
MTMNEMIPPTLPTYAAKSDFVKTGESFLRSSISLCGLRADQRVLDLGCGVGRFAAAVTQFLDEHGSYDGLDVARESIDWCTRAISSRYANFRFHLIDAYNGKYNPSGTGEGAEVVFPFGDDAFDLVFANSLFTHLLQADVENYAREITRVMKPGGRTLLTFFILDDEAEALVRAGEARWSLRYRRGAAHVEKRNRPESVVAYEKHFVHTLFESCGLDVKILPGAWSGRADHHAAFGRKDIVIGRKQ